MRNYRSGTLGLIEGRVLLDAPMKRFTSIGVGGPADVLFFPKDLDEVQRIVQRARKRAIPVTVVGRGTNLVVTDKGVRGWVIRLTEGLKGCRFEGETVEAEAGLSLRRLVQLSAGKGLTGLEAFYGIPGTVGGGLAMNAGAWGVEMKDVVLSVTFMDETGKVIEKPRSALTFSYRTLAFPPSWIILKGRFRLRKANQEEILGRMKDYGERRRRTQPLDVASAGSIFKNPKEGPAGKWIEETGLKGFRIGGAAVSEQHANVIVNLGKATAADVIQLMTWVEKRVYEEKGISLEREVKVIGE